MLTAVQDEAKEKLFRNVPTLYHPKKRFLKRFKFVLETELVTIFFDQWD
jgi:hypothetical protein